jgi:hypothetical protein
MTETCSDHATFSCDDPDSTLPDNKCQDEISHDIPPILDGDEVAGAK